MYLGNRDNSVELIAAMYQGKYSGNSFISILPS